MTDQQFLRPETLRFGLGVVLGLGLRAIGRSFLPFAAAIIVVSVLQLEVLLPALERTSLQFGSHAGWITAGMVTVNTVCDAALNGFVTGVILALLEDHVVDWRRALVRTVVIFPQLVLVSLAYATIARFGIFGFPPLLTGVVVLLFGTLSWTYAAVLVREGGNPFTAFWRSARLVQGEQSRIFVLLLVFIFFYLIAGYAGRMLVGAIIRSFSRGFSPHLMIGMTAVTTQLVNGLAYGVAAAGYHLLRHEKDAADHASLAQVFD